MAVHIEFGSNVGAGRALADRNRIRAFTQRKGKRINQYGFAGAGLAGKHRETGAEFELQTLDNDKIGDGQTTQHGWVRSRSGQSRFQCSFSRSIA